MQISFYRFNTDDKKLSDFYSSLDQKYNYPKHHLIHGPLDQKNLNNIISTCENEYALLVSSEIFTPINFYEKVTELLKKANSVFSDDGWALIGNSGIEYPSNKDIKFCKNNTTFSIPFKSNNFIPVSTIETNVLLINIKSLRDKNVHLKEDDSIFILQLLSICYNLNLISCIHSDLFTYSTATQVSKLVDTEKFDKKIIANCLKVKQQPLSISIVTRTYGRSIAQLNRLLQSVDLLVKVLSNTPCSIDLVLCINNCTTEKTKEITSLCNGYSLVKFNLLEINEKEIKTSKQFVRLFCLKQGVAHSKSDYVWFVDDDDFVISDNFLDLVSLLKPNSIIIADTCVYREIWLNNKSTLESSQYSHTLCAFDYCLSLTGDNHTPICSIIYPRVILLEAFRTNPFLGDYFEDFAIFLAVLAKTINIIEYPASIAGISYGGDNTVEEKNRTHWQISYATFMSDLIQMNQLTTQAFYDLLACNVKIKNQLSSNLYESDEKLTVLQINLNHIQRQYEKLQLNYEKLQLNYEKLQLNYEKLQLNYEELRLHYGRKIFRLSGKILTITEKSMLLKSVVQRILKFYDHLKSKKSKN